MENFIYLANFPKELTIKYLVNAFHGDLVLVTENEEVGCPCIPQPTFRPQGLSFLHSQTLGSGAHPLGAQ